MSRIKLEEMKKALKKILKEKDMDPDQAEEMADRVMNLFGYDRTITDNLLSSEERDIFYLLEDFDILTSQEESTRLPSGKRWRIHYWVLKEDKLREMLGDEEEEEEEEESVYKEISDEVWERAEE